MKFFVRISCTNDGSRVCDDAVNRRVHLGAVAGAIINPGMSVIVKVAWAIGASANVVVIDFEVCPLGIHLVPWMLVACRYVGAKSGDSLFSGIGKDHSVAVVWLDVETVSGNSH